MKDKTLQQRNKEAFRVFTLTKTKEEVITKQLKVIRHLADGPIIAVGDNARIHLTPEVGHTQQSRLNLGYLLFIH